MIDTITRRIGIKINWELVLKAAYSLTLLAIIIKVIDEIEKPRPVSYFTSIPQAPKKRKDFSESTKKETRQRQGYVCNICKKPPEFWEYHHKNKDRSNNFASNCEGLCPLCHAKKTRKQNIFGNF